MAEEYWQKLEDTRQGKNICEKCNQPREMYYSPWCPRCDIPKPEPTLVMNLLKSLRHLEVIGKYDDIEKKVWDYIVKKQGNHFLNDSYLELDLPKTPYSYDWDDNGYKCSIRVFNYLYKLSELVDFKDVIWYLSW